MKSNLKKIINNKERGIRALSHVPTNTLCIRTRTVESKRNVMQLGN